MQVRPFQIPKPPVRYTKATLVFNIGHEPVRTDSRAPDASLPMANGKHKAGKADNLMSVAGKRGC